MAPPRLPTHLRLVAPLGSGGSGEVWVARDRRAGRDVAVKLVPLGPGGGERLAREARALLRLAGLTGVAALHEVGTDGAGHGWLSTELVDGPTLAQRLAAAPLGGPDAAELLADVAGTLNAAHRLGVVHGDVTPANVVLHDGRGPVLVDWGLAGLGDAGGTGVGGYTPGYASPERRRGRPPSAAGDVYAAAATALAALGHAPDPGALVPRLAADLPDPPAAALRAALVVDPRRRPSADELAHLARGGPAADGPPGRRRRSGGGVRRVWGRRRTPR